ncbi:MAG TPA: zinc ribbon domain-containing protein [Candidatus Methanofastidiosa archaeon]|nr:zinc ribbon domain-containing protein [Candidatus Methanofastidiosa archaeon]
MKCPSCGETIPDEIDICPNCGYLIKYSDKSKKSMMPGKYIGALLVILIVVATLGYYFLYGGTDDYYAPYDADFYVKIEGEALTYGSSELPSSVLDEVDEEYEEEMTRLLNNIDTLEMFGWEENPEDVVMIIKPVDTEEFEAFLESELGVSSTMDIEGHDFNLVEDDMGYLWLDGVCLIGSSDGIEKSIKVNRGDVGSLNETDAFKGIMDHMPASQVVIYASVMDSEQVLEYEDMLGEMPEFAGIGALASGINTDDGVMTVVMEMASEEDASSASKKVSAAMMALKAMMAEDISFEYDITAEDNYLALSITVEELDLEELMSEGLVDPSSLLEGDLF